VVGARKAVGRALVLASPLRTLESPRLLARVVPLGPFDDKFAHKGNLFLRDMSPCQSAAFRQIAAL
jgi:hypothetical protein